MGCQTKLYQNKLLGNLQKNTDKEHGGKGEKVGNTPEQGPAGTAREQRVSRERGGGARGHKRERGRKRSTQAVMDETF